MVEYCGWTHYQDTLSSNKKLNRGSEIFWGDQVSGKLVYQGTPGEPTVTPVAMGGGLLWWPNASWMPVVPPIGAGAVSTYARAFRFAQDTLAGHRSNVGAVSERFEPISLARQVSKPEVILSVLIERHVAGMSVSRRHTTLQTASVLRIA